MIKVENTENYLGVTISGDYDDLDMLLEALYTITIDESDEKYAKRYFDMSTRLLSLAYDIRHAIQGDREIEFVDNGINKEKLIQQKILAHNKNIYFSVNVFYPELIFELLAINELINIRMDMICKPKNDYEKPLNKMVVWDGTISILRLFQSQVNKAVKELLTENTYARWIKIMNDKYKSMAEILDPYLDQQNIKYINMTKENRIKKLSSLSKKIVEYEWDIDFMDLQMTMRLYALENNVPINNIEFDGIVYPEDFDW